MALTQTQVSQLYVSIFNRASEGEGNKYWQQSADAKAAANNMLATPAAQAYFGTSLDSNEAFIKHIYLNTLNKTYAQDKAGVDYWVSQLDAGKSRGEVVAELVYAVSTYKDSTDPVTKAAYDQFNNRVDVSNYMANTVEKAPADYKTSTAFATTGTTGLVVTNNASTVTTAKNSVQALTIDGKTFTLTTGADVETANVFNSSNTFVAGTGYVNTLNDNDVLTGLGDNAELNVQIGASNDIDVDTSIQPTLANIATVNVEFINSGDKEATLNLRDATGLNTVNIDRITDNSAEANVTEMDATVTAISLNNATKAGTVTFSHKEEVLTGTSEELTFTANSARAKDLKLVEAGDGVADTGFYFETVNITTTGNNDFDAMTIQANGREDLLLDQPANTTTQNINITANGTVATGSLEINAFTAAGAETINIVANARVEIAKDNKADLDDSNDGITTDDLETMTISGAADVMIDGLDTKKDVTLTVNAGTMTGDLSLGVKTPSDATAEDLDLAVTSGSGNDTIITYGALAGSITTNDGDDSVSIMNPSNAAAANMEGVSSISTGKGNDTITVADMLAFGDDAGQLRNDGADSAATIDAGNGNNTITVGALNSAINWDDNNPNDANVDDLYSVVGASIVSGDGTDTVNISGAMAENTSISVGAGSDTINYTIAGLGTVLAGDTDSAREVVSVDNTTTTQDTTTIDIAGATIDLGEGNDTITFTDIDLVESATTLIAAGDTQHDGAGAKLIGGAGNDTLNVVTTDNMTIVEATSYTSATNNNTAALIEGIETVNLTIANAVDTATETATGVTATDTTDMVNTTVTFDVMRADSDLTAINLVSEEKSLMTLTGSEQYESGDDTTFTLNNMRNDIALSLTAFDATAVVGATNAAVATGAIEDDGAIDINNNSVATNEIDVTLKLDFEVTSVNTNADSFTFEIKDGTYGDERDSGVEGYDLSLTLGTTNQKAAWTTATSTTDDNDLVIENLTLDIADSKNHLIDLNGFGDGQQITDARANQVNAVATSLIVTGSADNAKIDLYNVTADTITANIAADVDLYVGNLSNKYTITTGSGNDNIDMTNDLVTANMTAVTGDESDTVAAGSGTDRLIINGGNDLIGVGTSSLEGDPFAQITGVEILRVDADRGAVDSNKITLDDTAMATGISTLEIEGAGDQRIDLILSDGFDRNLEIKSGTMVIGADNTASLDSDANNRYTARANEATYLSIDSQDALLDTDTSNLTVTMGLEEGSELHFINSGLAVSTVTVNVITANEAQATTIRGLSDDVNTTADLIAGSTYTTVADQMLISKTTGGDIDVLNILEAESADLTLTDDDAAITVTVSDSWAATAMTINASGILDTDSNVATGGVTVDGSMEKTAALTITGGANSDTLIGGNGSDTISGGAGNDTIIGDNTGLIVVEGTQGVQTVTFHDNTSFEIGDTYTIVVGTNTYVYIVGDNKITVNGVATTVGAAVNMNDVGTIFATAINNANVDADADADVSAAYVAPVNPADGGVLTITGIDVAADNDGGTADLGETIDVTLTTADTVLRKEKISIDLNQVWHAGDTITIDVDGGGTATYTYTVGAGLLPLGTVVAASTVVTAIAAAIQSPANAATAAIVDAVANGTTLELTADTAGIAGAFLANTTVVVSNTGNRVKTLDFTLADYEASEQVSVTVGTNTYTLAASVAGDISSDLVGGLQTFLNAQYGAGVVTVSAPDATSLIFTGNGTTDFTSPVVIVSGGNGGSVSAAVVAVNATDTINTNPVLGTGIVRDTMASNASADSTQEATQATVTAAAAALMGDSNVDTLNGGTGNDTLIGGGGADIIDGGEGTDTASYANSADAVTVSLALATAQVSAGEANGDVLTSIENLTGSAFADTLTGNSGVNVLTGNAGADVFNYTSLATVSAQTGITLATADTIADFVSGSDTIKFGTAGTALNYAEAAAAAATFADAQTAANTAMNGTVAYYLTSSTADATGLLFVDSNLDGNADAVIKMTGINSGNFASTDIIA